MTPRCSAGAELAQQREPITMIGSSEPIVAALKPIWRAGQT